jgi:hypothetical protein
MKSNMKNGKSRRGKPRKNGGYDKPPPPKWLAPPNFIAQPDRRWRLQFTSSAAGQVTFSPTQIGSMIGVIAASATTSNLLSNVFRLRRMSLWAWPTTVGTLVTISLGFTNAEGGGDGQTSRPRVCADTSNSLDTPAYVTLKPQKGTDSTALWYNTQTGNTTGLIIATVTTGTIMELDVDFVVDDLGTPNAGPALVAATLGVFYHKIINNFTVAGGLNAI